MSVSPSPVLFEVSEHLLRELVYGLNAALLAGEGDAEALTERLVLILAREGPRFHEPALLDTWAAALQTEPDGVAEQLEEAIAVILEELEDDEDPWSAHRLLDLLAEEPFWILRWGAPGEVLPAAVSVVQGFSLPLAIRVGMVRIFDQLELQVFEAYQAQRSVHDGVPERVLQDALDRAMSAISGLAWSYARRGVPRDLSDALVRSDGRLPPLRGALETIQRWKVGVGFDAAPDDDDGEWTMRVIERLYRLEWVLTP